MNQNEMAKCAKIGEIQSMIIGKTNQMVLTKKVLFKYKIMIARHKISFMAAQQGSTIKEMIMRQILKTNEALKKDRIVESDLKYEKEQMQIFQSIMNIALPLSEAVKPLKDTVLAKAAKVKVD